MIKDTKYYEGLDKRTSEYKTWAKFNKMGNTPQPTPNFPKGGVEHKLREIGRPFTKVHFQVYGMYRDSRTLNVWNENDIDLLISLYAHVYSIQYHSKNLTKDSKGAFKNLKTMSTDLDVAYESYKKDLKQ